MADLTLSEMMRLRPFDPEKDKPVSLPGGSYATEYLATSIAPDGQWIAHPQIWWGGDNGPRYLAADHGLAAAMMYEQFGNEPFPRFKTSEEADNWAAGRSSNGGGTSGRLR